MIPSSDISFLYRTLLKYDGKILRCRKVSNGYEIKIQCVLSYDKLKAVYISSLYLPPNQVLFETGE